MAELMQALRKEHMDMAVLLDLMDRQIAIFQQGAAPDFDVVRGIIGYFLTFPDLYHHPKEDLIVEKLRSRAPDKAAALDKLLDSHQDLAHLTRRFATAAIDQLVRPGDEPRAWFSSLARDFIDSNRRHMAIEEERFFPLAVQDLTDEDWAELDEQLNASKAEAQFHALHKAILEQAGLDRDSAGRSKLTA